MKKEIEFEKFKEAGRYAVSRWFKTDMTDWDNWCGITEFLECIWSYADKDLPENEDAVKAKIGQKKPPKFEHLFGNFYIKISNKLRIKFN